MKSKTIITIVIISLVAAGLGFFAGTQYQASRQPQSSRNPQAGQRQRFQGGGFTTGEVTAADNQSLTLKTADGSSKLVIISGTTNYQETTPATLSKIAVGSKITVIGETNSNGSITARTVSIGDNFLGQPRPTSQPQQ